MANHKKDQEDILSKLNIHELNPMQQEAIAVIETTVNTILLSPTGTGKTLTIKYIIKDMRTFAKEKKIPLSLLYINCKLMKVGVTEYRLIAELLRLLGKEIPPTGLPTDEVYKIFFSTINCKKQLVVIILDEIDQLVKKAGDEILYNLTRINEELDNSELSLVGISNDLCFADSLDPRVKSSLSEENIVFPPYNALQIQDILRQRAEKAFRKGALEEGVIEKCAAYAAREHGDARRALELFRVAGEIAEREGSSKVKVIHIDKAEEKIERDKIIEMVKTQPKQFQATLYSILLLYTKRNDILFTGEVYELYRDICVKTNLRPLTQRRISDIIAELDMLGIINAKVISKGRYGRTREISILIPQSSIQIVRNILEKSLEL